MTGEKITFSLVDDPTGMEEHPQTSPEQVHHKQFPHRVA